MPDITFTGYDSKYNSLYLVTNFDGETTLKATSIMEPYVSAITELLQVDD